MLVLRKIKQGDCSIISDAFKNQNWDKPISQYQEYFKFQENRERDVIIATWDNQFAGYLTIKWQSDYAPFKKVNIPEVVDFNVLKKYQRLGIGTALMDEAENRIRKIADFVGIGFGVIKDYGAAQILYVKRGYIPDGNGMTKNSKSLTYGDKVTVDDSLVFHLLKRLK